MSDEQVLSMALQKAKEIQPNRWWINDREAYLVFDSTHPYNISPATYAAFNLEVAQDAADDPQPIALMKPKIARMQAP